VVFDKLSGIDKVPKGEGTHFKIPFLQVPIIMDIRSRPRSIHSVTGTKDLQMVNISLRVLSHPKQEALSDIYQQLGTDYDERILPSIGNEVLKSIVAQYNAEELLSKRAEVSKGIREALIMRAAKFNLILDDVSITHLTFGKEFAKAIEEKQVAQQEAETQAYVVMKADQERKAAIIRAEGEAEAANLISKAMAQAGDGMIEVRRIDTAKEVAHIIARGHNVTYLPSGGSGGGSNMLLNIPGGNSLKQ
jgi:prohibitin 1